MTTEEKADAAIGYAVAMGAALESLIEILARTGRLEGGAILEAIDEAMRSVEEQPVSRGFSQTAKDAQHAALTSLLERLEKHPAIRTPSSPPRSS
jgi:hypothetical protein